MWINLTLLTIYTFNGRTISKELPQSYMPLTHFKTILRKILESRDLFMSEYMSTISLATSQPNRQPLLYNHIPYLNPLHQLSTISVHSYSAQQVRHLPPQ